MEQNNKPENLHTLKTYPEYFNLIFMGHKDWELRKNDRDFKIGDIIVLKEYDPTTKKYSGRQLARRISYILEDAPNFGLKDGYIIMSIQ